MASLKETAKSKAGSTSSKSSLASKVKAKVSPEPKEDFASLNKNSTPVTHEPNISMPAFNTAPPLPPALAYIKHLANIPGLRKRAGIV